MAAEKKARATQPSTEKKAEGTKTAGRPLDLTGHTVRKNIGAIREAQNMQVTELSRRMKALGRSIPPLGLHRIESGDRRVDVDDLVALAIALSVSPASLLMPNLATAEPDEIVDVTGLKSYAPDHDYQARSIWRWLTGQYPIVRDYEMAPRVWMQFWERSWPKWQMEDVVNKWNEEHPDEVSDGEG